MSWLDLATSRAGVLATNLALCAIWARFAVLHGLVWLETRDPPLLFFVLSETLVAVLFLVRRPPEEVSPRLSAWLVAIAGSFPAFLFDPTGARPTLPAAGVLVLVGTGIQVLGALSLNRSFGIVPALRGVRTEGLYRFVRHPIYASYLVTWSGYLGAYTSTWNVGVLALAVALTVARIHAEEELLSRSEVWRAYAERVRWRLIPLVW